jgi:hypothetical protein
MMAMRAYSIGFRATILSVYDVKLALNVPWQPCLGSAAGLW